MREVAHTSSRHANFASTENEAHGKKKTNEIDGRMCSKFGGKLQPANIERTQFVLRVNAGFSIALPSLQRQFNAMSANGSTFIQRLQFYFSFHFAHVTSKHCRCCLFGLFASLGWAGARIHVNAASSHTRNGKILKAEHARCRSQPMKIRWILWHLANTGLPVPRAMH